MVNTYRLVFISFIFLTQLTYATAQAKDTCEVQVQPLSGAMDDHYELTLSTSTGNSNTPPSLHSQNDFKVKNNGTQTFTRIVNGSMTSELKYSYQLIPKRTGVLYSPTFSCHNLDGTTHNTSAIAIKVSKGAQKLLLRQSINKLSAYEGEQIRHSLEVLTRVKLYDVSISQPTASGAWFEELFQGQKQAQEHQNTEFQVFGVDRALFPLQVGTLKIPAQTAGAKIKERVQQNHKRMSIFDIDPFNFGRFDFNSIRVREIEVNSAPIEIEVKALPPKPSNASFWNSSLPIVGKTSIKVIYDNSEMTMGDSRTLNYQLTSHGNLNTISSLPKTAFESKLYRSYQEAATNEKNNDSGKLVQTKEFKVSVVPLKAGQLSIPPLKLTYFDPVLDQYRVVSTDPIQIKVNSNYEETNKLNVINEPKLNQNQTNATYVEPNLLKRLGDSFSTSLLLLIIFVFLLLITLVALLVKLSGRSRSQRKLIRRIKSSNNLADIRNILIDFLENKLKRDLKHLPTSEIHRMLESLDIDQNITQEVNFCLSDIDRLLFSKQTVTNQDVNRAKESFLNISKTW